MMENRRQIQEISGALRATLEKARADFGGMARNVRWGEGPIFVCGADGCAGLSHASAYAFETLPGWPVVARPVEVFLDYDLALFRPRAMLLMISAQEDWPEGVELATAVHERGGTVAVLTNFPGSALAKRANHLFDVRVGGDANAPTATVCMHAALNFLAFEAMCALKKPKPWWNAIREGFQELPGKIEWVFTQLAPALRSMAQELARAGKLRIVGGGFYYYPAWQAARRVKLQGGRDVEAHEASEFWAAVDHLARRGDAILFISGSHSKMKKRIHRCAARARSNGSRVFTLTDANDHDLAEQADVGILIPGLPEEPSCALAMFMLEWLAAEILGAARVS